ncbi:LysM peptidoglycan-binding domain-containing protein, partial [Lactiplantibacillus plantarum]
MKIKNLVLSSTAALALFAISTTVANADTYTVKAGDTVSAIAQAHNTSVSAIEKANKLANVNLIFIGDKLEVNGTTTTTTTSAATSAAPQSATSQATSSTATSASATSASSQSVASQATSSAATSSAASQASSSATSLAASSTASTTSTTSTQTTQQTTTTQSSAQTSQTQAQPSQASQTQSSQTQTSKPAAQTTTQRLVSTSNYSNNGSDSAAKAWIAGKESGGSYSARNGQYIGKYQLSASY